jgi:hypothetical protein
VSTLRVDVSRLSGNPSTCVAVAVDPVDRVLIVCFAGDIASLVSIRISGPHCGSLVPSAAAPVLTDRSVICCCSVCCADGTPVGRVNLAALGLVRGIALVAGGDADGRAATVVSLSGTHRLATLQVPRLTSASPPTANGTSVRASSPAPAPMPVPAAAPSVASNGPLRVQTPDQKATTQVRALFSPLRFFFFFALSELSADSCCAVLCCAVLRLHRRRRATGHVQ